MANINKAKKYHFIYKTTNLLNGKYYVGMHSTSNLKDGYLGSGTRLRRSIRKYGESNFKLEILEFLSSREDLARREKELVNEDLIKDSNCLNLKAGGEGGFTVENAKKGRKAVQEKYDLETIKRWNSKGGKVTFEKHGVSKSWSESRASFKGKTHRIETIQKMKESKAGHGVGKENSQYGTQWINNGEVNKKIKVTSIIPTGWKLGRVLKK